METQFWDSKKRLGWCGISHWLVGGIHTLITPLTDRSTSATSSESSFWVAILSPSKICMLVWVCSLYHFSWMSVYNIFWDWEMCVCIYIYREREKEMNTWHRGLRMQGWVAWDLWWDTRCVYHVEVPTYWHNRASKYNQFNAINRN